MKPDLPAYDERLGQMAQCRFCQKWHECNQDGVIEGMCDAEHEAKGYVRCPNCYEWVHEYHQAPYEEAETGYRDVATFCLHCDPKRLELERDAAAEAAYWAAPGWAEVFKSL